MATGSRNPHRPRFHLWLIEQINSNRYPGLVWLDDEHCTFRVPWKHLRLSEINQDFAIFKAWAQISGKDSQSFEEATTWKHNFSCALKGSKVGNQKVFEEICNVSNHQNDPHKVFKIKVLGTLHAADCSNDSMPDNTGLSTRVVERNTGTVQSHHSHPPQPLQDQGWGSSHNCNEGSTLRGTAQTEPAVNIAIYGTINQPEENSFYETAEQQRNSSTVAMCSAILRDFMCPPGPGKLGPHGHFVLTSQPLKPAATAAPCQKRKRTDDSCSTHDEQVWQDPVTNEVYPRAAGVSIEQHGQRSTMVGQDTIHQGHVAPAAGPACQPDLPSSLKLSIYYRWKPVLQQEVKHTRCLLSYNQKVSSLGFHQPVFFPSPNHLPDQKQVKYTNKVLKAIQKGLLLEVKRNENRIYATWLGSSSYKVFWATARQLASLVSEPKFLQKDSATEIFNFKTFFTELAEYCKGGNRSPDFTIYFCFGQKFSIQKPKEDKLVLVEMKSS